MRPLRWIRRGLLLAGGSAVALAAAPALPGLAELAAQAAAPAPQMRQFWHVFVAYGIAWGLVFGWAVAIFRRLGRVEAELKASGLTDEGARGGSDGSPPR
jgi:hypothetical protein